MVGIIGSPALPYSLRVSPAAFDLHLNPTRTGQIRLPDHFPGDYWMVTLQKCITPLTMVSMEMHQDAAGNVVYENTDGPNTSEYRDLMVCKTFERMEERCR